MTTEGFQRKLTAILSADVAGYSRLMGEEEEATVRTLTKYKEIIFGLIKDHHGRLVDSPGDNVLAEFASVVEAVKCAVEIQKDLKEINKELSSNKKMEFRIGINIGDVIQDGDRIYGDGVNIAARIESLADPGGICISRTAYDQVKTKIPIDYEYLGKYEVKNIKEPVRVYKVLMESIPDQVIEELKSNKTVEVNSSKKKSIKIPITIIFIIIFISAGLFFWEFYPSKVIETEQSSEVSDEKQAPKTIAVLPFENLSSEKDQEYFADGIAEELLNSLTRISGLEVRGRTSSFYFKGKNESLPTISKMLNVDHILEGSVRKAGKQVRITVQLINTQKDVHIWSKTYDRELKDIFDVQDDIAKSVANALQITLGVGELGRAPGMTRNIAAYDAYLAGRSLGLNPGRENISQAIEKLEQAVAIDPDFAIGWYALADAYDVSGVWIPEKSKEFSVKEKAALSRVVELIPETDLAIRITASQSGNRMEEERLLKKALALAPDKYEANEGYGLFLCNVGRPMEAIDYIQRLVRLEPLVSSSYLILGIPYHMIGNKDAAAIATKKARDLSNQPAAYNSILLMYALEENNRALIDEYVTLLLNTELLGNINRPDTRAINQVIHAQLDTPENARDELRVFMADPAYINPMNRSWIAVWASYFGDYELALQACRESINSDFSIFQIWRPIHKGMRRLPGFKDLVRDLGLVDYWQKSGNWGDFCKPVGDNDFECE